MITQNPEYLPDDLHDAIFIGGITANERLASAKKLVNGSPFANRRKKGANVNYLLCTAIKESSVSAGVELRHDNGGDFFTWGEYAFYIAKISNECVVPPQPKALKDSIHSAQPMLEGFAEPDVQAPLNAYTSVYIGYIMDKSGHRVDDLVIGKHNATDDEVPVIIHLPGDQMDSDSDVVPLYPNDGDSGDAKVGGIDA